MKMNELDLAIANMDSAEAEVAVAGLLENLPGIHGVRLIERGAWISYDAHTITKDQISAILHHASFRAGLFQDSYSGQTGVSSV